MKVLKENLLKKVKLGADSPVDARASWPAADDNPPKLVKVKGHSRHQPAARDKETLPKKAQSTVMRFVEHD